MERGLIRFVSENGIKNRTRFQWTPRVISYTALLGVLIGIFVVMMYNRSDFNTTILRQRGSTFQVTDNNEISNIFEMDLSNKTKKDYNVKLICSDPRVKIQIAGKQIIKLPAEKYVRERFVTRFPYDVIKNGTVKIDIIVVGNGREIARETIKLIGPSF